MAVYEAPLVCPPTFVYTLGSNTSMCIAQCIAQIKYHTKKGILDHYILMRSYRYKKLRLNRESKKLSFQSLLKDILSLVNGLNLRK